jgi:hypothetical protein
MYFPLYNESINNGKYDQFEDYCVEEGTAEESLVITLFNGDRQSLLFNQLDLRLQRINPEITLMIISNIIIIVIIIIIIIIIIKI